MDVVASHQCHGLLVEPALRIDLAVKGFGDLAAGRVAEVRPVPLARAVERGPFQLPGLAILPVSRSWIVAIGFYLPLGRVPFTLVRGLRTEWTHAFHARFVRYRDAGFRQPPREG